MEEGSSFAHNIGMLKPERLHSRVQILGDSGHYFGVHSQAVQSILQLRLHPVTVMNAQLHTITHNYQFNLTNPPPSLPTDTVTGSYAAVIKTDGGQQSLDPI